MSLLNDIVNTLADNLPRFTDKFSENVSVSSLTRSGTTVTVVTAQPHGLVVGQFFRISGAKTPFAISSVVTANAITTKTIEAIAITTNFHDLSKEDIGNNIEITGANEVDFNGNKKLIRIINPNSFVFEVANTAPASATGTIYLLREIEAIPANISGYNGLHAIATVPNTTTLTYEISSTPESPAQGTIKATNKQRIYRAGTAERAEKIYTEQKLNEFCLFVVDNGGIANKAKSVTLDVNFQFNTHNSIRGTLINSFSLLTFAPSADSITGANAIDSLRNEQFSIYRSILGAKLPSPLSDGNYSLVSPSDFSPVESNGAYVIYQWNFELLQQFTSCDGVDRKYSVPFRRLEISYNNDNYEDVDTKSINKF